MHILSYSDTLFRSDKLVNKTMLNLASPAPPPGVIGSGLGSNHNSTSSIGSAASTVTPGTSTNSTPAPASAATYARAIRNASPPPTIKLPLQVRSANVPRASHVKAAQPAWNPGPRGLDPPIQVSQTALEGIKKRKDSNKLCNNHYLRGPCAKGDMCCFEHKYKPTKDEINAIAFLTRLNPCQLGQDCDVDDCIYGHHVSFPPSLFLQPLWLSFVISCLVNECYAIYARFLLMRLISAQVSATACAPILTASLRTKTIRREQSLDPARIRTPRVLMLDPGGRLVIPLVPRGGTVPAHCELFCLCLAC